MDGYFYIFFITQQVTKFRMKKVGFGKELIGEKLFNDRAFKSLKARSGVMQFES
jgi:hypothetical protein